MVRQQVLLLVMLVLVLLLVLLLSVLLLYLLASCEMLVVVVMVVVVVLLLLWLYAVLGGHVVGWWVFLALLGCNSCLTGSPSLTGMKGAVLSMCLKGRIIIVHLILTAAAGERVPGMMHMDSIWHH